MARHLSRFDEEKRVGDVAHRDDVLAVDVIDLLHDVGERVPLGVGEGRQHGDRLEKPLGLGRERKRVGLHHDVSEAFSLERPYRAVGRTRHRGGTRRVVEQSQLSEGVAFPILGNHLAVELRERRLVRTAGDNVKVIARLTLADNRLVGLHVELGKATDHEANLVVGQVFKDLVLPDALLDENPLFIRLWAHLHVHVLRGHVILGLRTHSHTTSRPTLLALLALLWFVLNLDLFWLGCRRGSRRPLFCGLGAAAAHACWLRL